MVYWTPSISLSGLAFYLLVNDKLEELRRDSLLLPLQMRIRDVRQGADELLYALAHHQNGGVLQIEPSSTDQRPTN